MCTVQLQFIYCPSSNVQRN